LEQQIQRSPKRDGIKPILARVKQTRTNGKLERFFGKYENQWSAFRSFEDFIGQYSDTGIFLRRKKAK
jgi:transposase InsO family protein